MAARLAVLVVLGGAGVHSLECLVETQKCNFPFSTPNSLELHYSCQATTNTTNGSPDSQYFCRSQVGEEGQERHTYGLCNGGCFDEDGVTPMDFKDDDVMVMMCSTAASPCKFPFIWEGKEYLSCTKAGVEQFAWCALEVDSQGVLVKDKWGICDMDTCTEEVKQDVVVEPVVAVAEFKDSSVIGMVEMSQQAPDNEIDVRGKVVGLPQGEYSLRAYSHDCEGEGSGEGSLLGGSLDSDGGESESSVSTGDWRITLYPEHTSRYQVLGGSLVIEESCIQETNQGCDGLSQVACADIILKSQQTQGDNSILLIIVVLVVVLFLLLLLCFLLYCCFCRRRENQKISQIDQEERDSIEDIYLGSRSKSPLYDELSIPFIDASLPPTPKTGRSQNALEILLGRSIGSSTSLSDGDT